MNFKCFFAFWICLLANVALGHCMANNNITFTYWNGTGTVTGSASEYWGPAAGNTSNGTITIFGDSYDFIVKDDNSTTPDAIFTGTSSGVEFTLNVENFVTSEGLWSLSWKEINSDVLPVYFDFVFAVKAGNQTGYYLFKNIYLGDDPNNTGNGTYLIGFTKDAQSTVVNALSHLSVYGVPSASPTPVPEPTTMLLFGTGIAGLAGLARRKRD